MTPTEHTPSPTPPSTPPPGIDEETGLPIRPYARATGLVLQSVGAVLFLVTTCGCCLTALFEGGSFHGGPAEIPLAARVDSPSRADTVLLLTCAVGGMALMGFGLGQQGDRGQFPAIGCTVTTAVMTAAYGFALVDGWLAGLSWGFRLMALLLTLLSAALLLLVLPALMDVLRQPVAWRGPPVVPAADYPDPWAGTSKSAGADDEPIAKTTAKPRPRPRPASAPPPAPVADADAEAAGGAAAAAADGALDPEVERTMLLQRLAELERRRADADSDSDSDSASDDPPTQGSTS